MSSNSLEETLRKAIDLNMRFYSSLGRLTLDYWKELLATSTSVMRPTVSSTAPPVQTATPPGKPAVMVIEAETGSVGIGVFMVENHLGVDVDSTVTASAFKDARGSEVRPAPTFDPPRVVLKPGEQLLVRVSLTFGPELEPDVRYTGELVVPGLKGTRIPVVLRARKRP